MAPDSITEVVFLMVILKIPLVYLCYVIWYAIKAEPKRPEEGAAVQVATGPEEPPSRWRRLSQPRRPGPRPHGRPIRTYARTERAGAAARAKLGE